jgi:hypothetical protein
MKRSLLLIAVLCAMILSGNLLSATGKTHTSKRQTAEVEFRDQVKLFNVALKGRYLIVHDDEMMARGETCTFVYDLNGGKQKLVVSFHCIPVARAEVRTFTVRTSRIAPDAMDEVREFQFTGSGEAHQIPTS